MVMSPYDWKILEWEDKPQPNKETNTIASDSLLVYREEFFYIIYKQEFKIGIFPFPSDVRIITVGFTYETLKYNLQLDLSRLK